MGTSKFNDGGSAALDLHPIQGVVEILLVREEGGNAELSTGEHLTKRDLIRPEQAYLCKT